MKEDFVSKMIEVKTEKDFLMGHLQHTHKEKTRPKGKKECEKRNFIRKILLIE